MQIWLWIPFSSAMSIKSILSLSYTLSFCMSTSANFPLNCYPVFKGKVAYFFPPLDTKLHGWVTIPWRHLKDVSIWHLGTWFNGGLGSTRLIVWLSDLKGLFQSQWFYDSIIVWNGYMTGTKLFPHFSSDTLIWVIPSVDEIWAASTGRKQRKQSHKLTWLYPSYPWAWLRNVGN